MDSVAAEIEQRRPVIDLLRGVALLIVVAGHLTLAVIDRSNGEIRGTNLLELFPGWSWVTIIAPMPLFFLAGGFANATASFGDATKRLATFAALAAVVVAVWAVPVVIVDLLTGSSGIIGDGGRLATQPLWFFAAYAPLAALSPMLRRSTARDLTMILVGSVVVVAVCDLARFGSSGPEWIGWFGFLPTYGSFWVAGVLWRRISANPKFREQWVGVTLVGVCGASTWILASRHGYSWALIDAVPGKRSNTTPPTVFTVTAGFLQIGVVMSVAVVLDSVAVRRERFFRRLRNVAVGVYMWHLSALTLVSASVAAGLPLAPRFTPSWWVVRPLWYAAIAVVTYGLVGITEKVVTRLPLNTDTGRDIVSIPTRSIGVVLFAAAAAHIGLKGPRTAGPAVGLVVGLAFAWWLLARRNPAGQVESGGDSQVRDDL